MAYDLVTGDTGSRLVVTCKDKDGTAIDLTGATVRLQWEGENGVAVIQTMTINDAANGVASYQFAAGQIFAPRMVFEVEITDPLGNVVTSTEVITLTVREEID